ncbi:hypothetical protein BW730_04250 [Tessaracoccus aquimaris]|uniref:Metallo-beta-lactamase domain-containing protein n=1 Tax=Tessaracoccus aquimaris TaxID=1332264 RepID=A0A1Q2CL65_9ACTN|nr:ComEC/Rec2 family competence protein [Tessaracoccus aquimaris]AQP46854.1 hypothetical protein BW730_04250 [Tessaracoccus aquimaris]
MRNDWRLLPVAVAVWGSSLIATSGWEPGAQAVFALLAGLGLVALLCVRAGRGWAAVVVLVVVVTALTAGVRVWQRNHSAVAEVAADRAAGTAEVRLTSEPLRRAEVVVASADLLSLRARSREVTTSVPVVLFATGDVGEALLRAEPGAVHPARVRLAPAEPDDPAAALLSVRELGARIEAPGPLQALANAMRAGLREAVSHSPPDQAALVPSLVVGDTSRVNDRMRQDFRATGLTHLMAVSGANLSLLVGVLVPTVRVIGVRGWWVRGCAVAGVGFFILVCGQEPSVLRAAAMGLVALASIGSGRGRRSIRALCLAVAVLIWLDPWLSRSVGFALSVAACAGIVLLGPRFRDALLRWCPRWVAEAVAVSLAAQLATQPIVTAISEQVSVVAVATNVLAAPFVGPTTVLGLLAAVLSPLGAVATVPGWVAGWCSQPIVWIASAGAALPSATWEWSSSLLGVALVALASAAVAVVLVRLLRSPWGGVAFAVILVVASAVRPVPLGWPGEWSVAFCDVGQGDATAIRAGPDAAMLVDAGPEPGPTLACLDSLGVDRLPLLVLTHYHADHVGGAEEVIRRFRPGLILVREGPVPPWLAEAAGRAGGRVRSAIEGERIALGEAQWVSVSVPSAPVASDPEGEGSAENDASVVGVATSGGVRVLLAGDAEPAGQREALRSARAAGLPLAVDVLKLPHHGSARQEPRFFEASAARMAVASAGEDNDYGHPAKAALDLATGLGMSVARTDTQGTIALGRRGDSLTIAPIVRPR